MRKYLTLLKNEGKLWMRCPDCIIFGVLMPIGVLCLIGIIAGDKAAYAGASYTFLQGTFAPVCTVGVCATAFMSIPLTIADYRDKKILKHFFVTPCSPLLLLGVIVTLAGITAVVSLLMISAAAAGFGYRMEGNLTAFAVAYILIMISMYSIGMLMASLCKTTKAVNVACTFVYFPMIFLSGATIPYELFPQGLQKAASVLPLTQGIKLLKAVSLGEPAGNVWLPITVLGGIAVAGSIISVRTFCWE